MDNITLVEGDLLEAEVQLIAHQVNCQGVMGAGLARQIKDQYPEVYKEYVNYVNHSDKRILGTCLVVKTPKYYIANLFGQNQYGTHKRHTNYEAIYRALEALLNYCLINNIHSIGIPYGMSCGLAGGNWHIIFTMITNVFKKSNIKVEIYKLN